MTPELLAEANRLEEAIACIDKTLGFIEDDTLSILVFQREDTKLDTLDVTDFNSKVGPLDVDFMEAFKNSLILRRKQFQHEFGKLPETRDFNSEDFNHLDFDSKP